MTKEYDEYVKEECRMDEYLDRKAEAIEAGLIEDDEPAEEKETYCPVCKTQGVMWDEEKEIWQCQKCGELVE